MKARELVVSPCSLSEIKLFVETYHYSHNVNGVKIAQCFRVDYNNQLVGAIIYGAMSTTAWKKFGKHESEVLELRRLVLDDDAERNSESRVIGWTIRYIRNHYPKVKIIVSYADPAYGHTGTIYKASNFIYMGTSAADTAYYDFETNKTYHSRSLRVKYKGMYKPFAQRLRDKLAEGKLDPITLPGKHCFIFKVR